LTIATNSTLTRMIALNEVKDIEGKFGQAKRRFSLNRVMTKLANTSETAIAITFLVINLEALLKQLAFCSLLFSALNTTNGRGDSCDHAAKKAPM